MSGLPIDFAGNEAKIINILDTVPAEPSNVGHLVQAILALNQNLGSTAPRQKSSAAKHGARSAS